VFRFSFIAKQELFHSPNRCVFSLIFFFHEGSQQEHARLTQERFEWYRLYHDKK
jgi:hypothetical protein